MDNKNNNTILSKLFTNGIGVYFIMQFVAFVLNKLLNFVWLEYAPVIIVAVYIIWALISIYSSKYKTIFELDKKELVFYQIIIPVTLSILIGSICINIAGNVEKSFLDNVKNWLKNDGNQLFLIIIFSGIVLICYFIAYERNRIFNNFNNNKEVCQFPDKVNELCEKNENTSNEIYEEVKNIQDILEKKNQVGYTATCIPIRYNKEHDTFVFALIKNLSHEESQWMFPGSHVEVSNNELKEEFDLTDISIIPSEVIEEKVKKEAGLVDLQFIDPYYETVRWEFTTCGEREERSYPNTCYPVKAPVFNYLFRVSESAKCYNNQNHRCHYDFTYIGEYSQINEKDAEYEVIEIELNRSKDFEKMERADAIAHIISKLGQQINKKIKEKRGRNKKKNLNIPFDQLCLDSIPEMIYNAILFYIDYKKMKE